MKKIGFIGAFDKIDLVIYIAKVLIESGKRVLVIDTTTLEKTRYIVPTIAPTKFYVTEFEKIDVAVGFDDIDSADRYLGNIEDNYDIVLIDIDSADKFSKFRVFEAEKLYFVTAFDNYSLRKGVEIISNLGTRNRMTKVFFEREIAQENEEHLNLLSITAPVDWEEERIYFPYDQGDISAMIDNQRESRIRFRNLSDQYRDSLYMISQEIAPDVKPGYIRKIMKNI